MKKFKAHLYEIATGNRQTVSEDTREALIETLQTWIKQGWHVESFS